MRVNTFLRLPLLATATLLAVGCREATAPELTQPAFVRMVSGDAQAGIVGQALAQPLVVRVTDRRGRPVSHHPVGFTVSGGGSVEPASVQTDADGTASTTWTLGTSTADSQRVLVSVMNERTGQTLSLAIHAAANADVPAVAAATSDPACTGAPGVPLADSLAVRIEDQYGNGVPAARVAWKVMAGGGRISPQTALTDEDGVARGEWTLGTGVDGAQQAQALAEGAAPATFYATTGAPATLVLEKVSGDNQTAPWEGTVIGSLVVRLRLSSGEPVQGAPIEWSADRRASIVSESYPASSVTDARGLAKAVWRLAAEDDEGLEFHAWAGAAPAGSVSFTATAFAMPFAFGNLDTGEAHACALADMGKTYCWGRNDTGQLGTGDTRDRLSPAAVVADSGLASLAAGNSHTCGVSNGAAYCWGSNANGQLGTGTVGGFSTVPVPVAGGHTFYVLAAGASHTCGITYKPGPRAPHGQVYCWGRNDKGQLGDGTTIDRAVPTLIASVPEDTLFVEVSAGAEHTCATIERPPPSFDIVPPAGGLYQIYCWGSNDSGQLGSAPDAYRATPVLVLHSTNYFRFPLNVASGGRHTCVIWWSAADVECWGSNTAGQLGTGSPSGFWKGLSSGGEHTCALTTVHAYCWGSNEHGQLGNPEAGGSTPVRVAGNFSLVALIRSGGAFTCVRGANGHPANPGYAHCWGDNTYGQLGNGTTTSSPTPVLVR